VIFQLFHQPIAAAVNRNFVYHGKEDEKKKSKHSLDKLNGEVIKDYSDKGRMKTVETSVSKKYNDFILDFGGGHVYFEGVKDLLKGYKNVFVLIPSEDYELSNKILRENSINIDMRKMINHILKSIESPSCEFSDAKKEKAITTIVQFTTVIAQVIAALATISLLQK
jgi:hypothetical protein